MWLQLCCVLVVFIQARGDIGLEKDPAFKAFYSELETITSKISDVVFILDESGSIQKERFPMEESFVEVVTRLIGVSYERTRIAVISYSTTVRERFNYIKNPSGNNMCTVLGRDIPKIGDDYNPGSTRTYKALQYASNILANARPESQR